MMLTILNQEGNVVHRLISNFKNLNSSAGWREAGVLAAFPLAFAKKMFGLNLKSANTKTAGANKVLKSRKGEHNIAIDQC